MSFVNDLREMVKDMLQNVSLLKVKNIRSIGRKPMRIEHDAGGSITFNADGTITIIGSTSGGLWEVSGTETQLIVADVIDMQGEYIINADTIKSVAATPLTLESANGIFVFKAT